MYDSTPEQQLLQVIKIQENSLRKKNIAHKFLMETKTDLISYLFSRAILKDYYISIQKTVKMN